MSAKKVGFFSSIRGRLILANLSLVVVLVAISVVSSKQFAALGRTIGVVSDSAELLLHLGHIVDEREAATGALALGYADGDDSGARAKLEALLADFGAHLAAAEKLSAGGEEAALLRAALGDFRTVESQLRNFSALSEDERLEASTSAGDTLDDGLTMVGKGKLLAAKNMETRLLGVKGELKRPALLLWSATALGCVVALIVALFTNHRVARPISALMDGVSHLRSGGLRSIEQKSDDELGRLAVSFNEMAGTILEKNRSLELVLDNVADALFTVDRDGRLVGRPSRRAIEWFGVPEPREPFWKYLAPEDSRLAFGLEGGFEQIIDEILPFEIAADQLPKEIRRGERLYALQLRAVCVDGRLERILVVSADITERRALAEKEKRSRDRYSLASLGMRDPDGYSDFCRDTRNRLEQASQGKNTLFELHTIKGNASVMGCECFAEAVHQAETALAENADVDDVLARVRAEWHSLESESERALGRTANEVIVVRREHYDRLLRLLDTPGRTEDARALAQSWSMLQLGNSLSRLAATAERYAVREGKRVEVRHEGEHIAVRRGQLDELWACLSHLVKNAVAHGVEPESERVEKGKSPVANIVVSAKVNPGLLTVEVADDGKGIDWQHLAEKSGRDPAAGIDLFLAGVSTANDVSDLAGRGVGVAAVVEVTKSLGGSVEVESEAGKGSVFKLKIPVSDDGVYEAKTSLRPAKS